MKLVEPTVELVTTSDPLIKIEEIGRVCYKSQSDFTRETAVKFIKSLISSGHLSVLEHATFVFEVNDVIHVERPFVRTSIVQYGDRFNYRTLASTNLRAIIEGNYNDYMSAIVKEIPEFNEIFGLTEDVSEDITLVNLLDIKDLTLMEFSKHCYTTFRFHTDRGVTHEMVRHRIASFTQESTRYCNYSRDKFGSEITCIIPANFEDWSMGEKVTYEQALEYAEMAYMRMLRLGATAQQARGVLPTDLATTIVMTANDEEWEHFFDLRSRGKTGAPHPNMRKVAKMAEDLYYEKYYTRK